MGIMFIVLVPLYCVLLLSLSVAVEDEVNRGDYPYMAFLYYTDDSVVDSNGNRFFQNAILLDVDWLISSSIDAKSDKDMFPYKTLMARAGATTIDPKVQINEDLDEQEREVVRIVRPTNHNKTTYWATDITLLKTLTPFNTTKTVGKAPFTTKTFTDNTCTILIFTKKLGMDRSLVQKSVDVTVGGSPSCRPEYVERTMVCGVDNATSVQSIDCMGNQGGPLICENKVVGLQTYLMNKCEAPYLYQLLNEWNSFIMCAAQDKCNVEYCKNVCHDTDKDEVKQDESTENITIIAENITVTRSHLETTTVKEISSTGVVDDKALQDRSVENVTVKKESAILDKNESTTDLHMILRAVDDSSEITKQADEPKILDEERPKIEIDSTTTEIDSEKPASEITKLDVESVINDESTPKPEPDESVKQNDDSVTQQVEPINQDVEPSTQEVETQTPNSEDKLLVTHFDELKPEIETLRPEIEASKVEDTVFVVSKQTTEPFEKVEETITTTEESITPQQIDTSPAKIETEAETTEPKIENKIPIQDGLPSRKRFDAVPNPESNIMKVNKKSKHDATHGLVQLISDYQPPKNSTGTQAPNENEDYFFAIMKLNDTKSEEKDKNVRVKMMRAKNTASKLISPLIRGLFIAVINLIILL